MKIGVYIPTASFFVGGGEVVPLIQSKMLSDLGYDLKIIVLAVNKESEYFQQFKIDNPKLKIDYLESPIPNITKLQLDHVLGHKLYLSLKTIFYEYCLNNKFDVVITHYAPAALTIPPGIKQILFLHGVPEKFEEINKLAFLAPKARVAVSKSVAEKWIETCGRKKVAIIYNGIDELKFSPYDPPIDEDIDILYIGRLIEIKGVQHLIKATAILRDKFFLTNLNIAICGSGPYEGELRKLVETLGIDQSIHFYGYVPTKELKSFYNRSKITVFPSFAKEGVLTTLLESAACGRCLLSANCCGMIEFIKNGENGILFKQQDSYDLAKKIHSLYTNDRLRQKLGFNARRTVLSEWTWTKSINKLRKLIDSL